jgi:hypothetical protein
MLRPEALKYLLALGSVLFVLSNVLGILMEIRLKRANQPTRSHLDLGRRYAKTIPESSNGLVLRRLPDWCATVGRSRPVGPPQGDVKARPV